MTAPHFFTDAVDGDTVTLTGEEARHAARVLRIQPGETISVADGRGGFVFASVRAVEAGRVLAGVTERKVIPAPALRVVVYPALPKGGKLDMVVQKLTEIGVHAIRPWAAERSVVRWDNTKGRAHGDRWRAIAREAAKQSRRAFLPDVADPAEPDPLPAVTIVLHESATAPLSTVLPEAMPAEVGVVIGPEGGLTDDEVESLGARGAVAATLGEQILRAETAAIIAPALVLAHFRLLG